jgi:hypothetical protein
MAKMVYSSQVVRKFTNLSNIDSLETDHPNPLLE